MEKQGFMQKYGLATVFVFIFFVAVSYLYLFPLLEGKIISQLTLN